MIGPELEDALRRAQVFQPVQAEIADVRAGEVGGRLRQQHLAAVAGRSDSRSAVHVEADVALSARYRLTGVQAHPHLDWAAGQSTLGPGGSRDGLGGARERHEERVPLRVDLDSVVLL